MNIFVTGGAGFIGSNLVIELVKQKYNVKVIDNLITGRIENLSSVKDKITFINASITNIDILRKELKDIDIVFHIAALPSVPRSVLDPSSSNESNVNGTLNVLIAAKENNVKRVIYAGSSSAYGDTPTLPKKEDMTPNPLSPYAVSKLSGEYYCKVFSEVYSMDTVTLRYFNVFGPMQNPDSQYAAVIPLFIKKMINDEQPVIYGDGEQTRDFTFVQNVVDANILAMKYKDKFKGDVFNVAASSPVTVNNLVKTINLLLKKDIKPIYIPHRKGEILHSFADITKASQALEYTPRINFEEGLKETIDLFRSDTENIEKEDRENNRR